MAEGKVIWNDGILAEIKAAEKAILSDMAFAIEAEAKVNLTNNNQVDTGFLRNSVYAVTPNGSTEDKIDPNGRYKSRKTGRMVDRRQSGQTVTINSDGTSAAVVAGADYAIHQEAEKSFLYRAGESVAKQSDAIITKNQLK